MRSLLKFTATDRTSVTPPALLISRNEPWPKEKNASRNVFTEYATEKSCKDP